MTRKALGRGLSALLGEDTQQPDSAEKLLDLDIDAILPNADQPRSRFADTEMDELVRSIRANGIIQPVIVRPQGTRFQLVAGERRWRAAKQAGLKKIPAVVKLVSDEKLLEIALIENIQRHDLNVIEEANAYRNLINNLGLTQETVAERVGKSRTVITTCLRLLRLPDDIQELAAEGKISAGHARALLMTDNIEKQRRVAKSIIENSLSVREAEKLIKRAEKPEAEINGKQTTVPSDPNVKAAETKLRRKFGTNVNIVADKKALGGRIEIEYYGNSDLDRLFQMLNG
jgi:ParB family transcriptional regulator, chromosome partitioning protein